MATNNQSPYLDPNAQFLDPGVPEEWLRPIAQGAAAQKKLEALRRRQEQAKEMGNAQLPGIQGRGFSATAPTLANALGVLAQQYAGNKEFNRLEAEAQKLGTAVTEGDLQKLRLNISQKMRPPADKFLSSGPGQVFNQRTGEFTQAPGYVDPDTRKQQEREYQAAVRREEADRKLANQKELAEFKQQFGDKGKPPTQGERKTAGYLSRMDSSENLLDNIETQFPNFDPASAAENIFGTTNLTTSKEMQLYRQAANEWIRAKLRKESGAVIGEQEMIQEYDTYFPRPGDSLEVIEQKRKSRRSAMESIGQEAGSAGQLAPQGQQESKREQLLRRRQALMDKARQ